MILLPVDNCLCKLHLLQSLHISHQSLLLFFLKAMVVFNSLSGKKLLRRNLQHITNIHIFNVNIKSSKALSFRTFYI